MGISLPRSLAVVGVVVFGVSGAFAQDSGDPVAPESDPPVVETEQTIVDPEDTTVDPEVAIVDPVAVPSRQSVLDQCAVVSLEECTALVRLYMDDLVASGRSQEEINQIAGDFVIELTVVAQSNPEIDGVDVNVVDAIRAVITYIDDPAQQTQLAEIANTIEANEDFQTAATAQQASPN